MTSNKMLELSKTIDEIQKIIHEEKPQIIMTLTTSRVIVEAEIGGTIIDTESVSLGLFEKFRLNRVTGSMLSKLKDSIMDRAIKRVHGID